MVAGEAAREAVAAFRFRVVLVEDVAAEDVNAVPVRQVTVGAGVVVVVAVAVAVEVGGVVEGEIVARVVVVAAGGLLGRVAARRLVTVAAVVAEAGVVGADSVVATAGGGAEVRLPRAGRRAAGELASSSSCCR